MDDGERNKRTVLEFYRLAFNEGRPVEAASRYMGATYVQHNPTVGDGIVGLVAFVKALRNRYPAASVEPRRIVCEGDMVVTHSVMRLAPEQPEFAVADFWRLVDGRIVEHWDVIQEIASTSINGNPAV